MTAIANVSCCIHAVYIVVMWMVVLVVLCLLRSATPFAARFQAIEEWNLWKEEHSREYLGEKVRCSVSYD